jgi:hypothetical protein
MDTVTQPVELLRFEAGWQCAVRATLAYDRKEPYEVRVMFPPGLERLDLLLARELLAGGLASAACYGCMRAWLSGGDIGDVCIGWAGPAGDARLEVPAASVARFLAITYCLVPAGSEPPRTDIDNVIAAILAEGDAR